MKGNHEAQENDRQHPVLTRSTSEVYYRDTALGALRDDESHSEPLGRGGVKDPAFEPRRHLSLHSDPIRQTDMEFEAHSTIEGTLRSLDERWQELTVLLEKVRLHHNKIKSELQDWQRYREASKLSRSEFHREARVKEDETPGAGCVEIIVNEITQLEALDGKMKDHARGVENSIRNMQLLSSGAEESAAAGFEEAEKPAVTGYEEAVGISVPPSVQSSPLPAHSQHSLIIQYWDKVGNVKLRRERLFDLDQEYEEEKALRVFFRDQELELEVSDKHFKENWLQVFANAELALVEAQHERDLALKLCQAEAIDPDAYRRRRALSELALTDSQVSQQDFSRPATPPPPVFPDIIQNLTLEAQKQVVNTRQSPRRSRKGLRQSFNSSPHLDRIAAWLNSVPQEESTLQSRSTSALTDQDFERNADMEERTNSESKHPGQDQKRMSANDLWGQLQSQQAVIKSGPLRRPSSDSQINSSKSRGDTKEWTVLSLPPSGSPRRQESVGSVKPEAGEGVSMRRSRIDRSS